MRKKLYILLYTVIFCVCTTYAQDDAAMRELYAQAEDAYMIGRIEQARDLLLQNLSTFQGNSRQNALHLIALTYMDEYDIPKTEQYVTLLLQQPHRVRQRVWQRCLYLLRSSLRR